MRGTLPLALCLLALFATPTLAMFRPPESVPIDRIIENLESYRQEHPDDPRAHYQLARAHYLAAAMDRSHVGVYEIRRDGHPPYNVADEDRQDHGRRRAPGRGEEPASEPLDPEARRHHTRQAYAHFRAAIEQEPDNALYHLGLASLLRQLSPLADRVTLEPPLPQLPHPGAAGDAPDEASPEDRWLRAAADHFYRAYELAIEEDLAADQRPIEGLEGFVSFEAAAALADLRDHALAAGLTRDQLAAVDRHRAALEETPVGAITPILLATEPGHTLTSLIDSGARVPFDLDGDGRVEQRPWPRPAAGFLVFDPAGEGRITSGRQMFGSVTWWLFWRDGYQALDALDDSRDGELAGDELAGLAVWFDRDADGVSDPGEVVPLSDLGVAALSTRATTREAGSPANPRGVRLTNGQTLPTWDWIAPAP